jgi:hypothetical protein
MPMKIRTAPKGATKSNSARPSIQDLVDVASQLPDSQLRTLRKKLDELHISRWRREREAVAKQIAAKRITEQNIDDHILRRRRESRG